MDSEETTSPELETMRAQVWQEVEDNWQKEVKRNPKLAADDPKVVYEGIDEAEINPELRANYEAGFKARKIANFLYNFRSDMPSKYNHFVEVLGPDYVYTDTHTSYSSLQYGKTIEQYYGEIAEAMKQAGISVEDWQRIEEERDKKTYGLTELKFQETLLDIYTRLRLINPNAPKFDQEPI